MFSELQSTYIMYMVLMLEDRRMRDPRPSLPTRRDLRLERASVRDGRRSGEGAFFIRPLETKKNTLGIPYLYHICAKHWRILDVRTRIRTLLFHHGPVFSRGCPSKTQSLISTIARWPHPHHRFGRSNAIESDAAQHTSRIIHRRRAHAPTNALLHHPRRRRRRRRLSTPIVLVHFHHQSAVPSVPGSPSLSGQVRIPGLTRQG
jgi:hypothetical protein